MVSVVLVANSPGALLLALVLVPVYAWYVRPSPSLEFTTIDCFAPEIGHRTASTQTDGHG